MKTDEVRSLMPEVAPGDPCTHRNLTVFPLLGGLSGDPDYLTLDEALSGGSARITEVNAGGSVPELRFENLSEYAVLMLDGEELVGAKQNRTLNVTILAAARSSITIPVTCIEAGRWSFRSDEFQTTSRMHHARARRMKSDSVSANMRASGRRFADQGMVWEDIADKMAVLESPSPTSALSDVFERNAPRLEDYVKAFEPVEGQAGAVFALNGEVVGLDVFDFQATFRRVFPKLLYSYALDAIEGKPVEKPVSRSDVEAFLTAVRSAEGRRYKALGEGDDVRLSGPGVVGASLEARERTVHLTAFRREEGSGPVARMRRASSRRLAFE
jgi:hypothetical protein